MTDRQVPDLSTVASPPRKSLNYGNLDISEEPLGAGGQAVVYEATVSGSGAQSKVALKEPRYSGTITHAVSESFLKEAKTWQTVDQREREKPRWNDYEHIVGVVDTGEHPFPWIAMEYMDGGDLENRLDNASDGLSIDETLWIGECLCRGLEVADELGFAHLDVKPKNILFRQTPENTYDVPKLADWGVARSLAEESGTMEAQTIKYSAPEQFDPSKFGDPDSLTDLYQVGAVVYAMLTGDPPHTGSNQQIMRQVLDSQPAPPSQQRRGVSEAIDVTVTTALAKSKTDRYRGLQHFEEALRAIRTDERLPAVIKDQIEHSATGKKRVPNKQERSPPHRSESPGSDEQDGTTVLLPPDSSTLFADGELQEHNFANSSFTEDDVGTQVSKLDLTNAHTSNVENMEGMFLGAERFDQDIVGWDTSNVETMRSMFMFAKSFNQVIAFWNTSNVENMQRMFHEAESFDQEINRWDTGNVENMSDMFHKAKSFDQYIGGWDTSNVKTMEEMFRSAESFNQDISRWDTGNVKTMESMFKSAESFDQDIGGWNTSNVETMESMFKSAKSFDHDIGDWDTSNVKNMQRTFNGAKSFDQDIGGWNTSNVEAMDNMFSVAISFDQDTGGWNTSNVETMSQMFQSAESFDQDIGGWNTSNVETMNNMFMYAESFDQDISAWCVERIPKKPVNFDNYSGFEGVDTNQPNWGEPC